MSDEPNTSESPATETTPTTSPEASAPPIAAAAATRASETTPASETNAPSTTSVEPDNTDEPQSEPLAPAPAAEEESEIVPLPVPTPEPASESPAASPAEPVPAEAPQPVGGQKKWYILKVPSGREDSTKRNLERKIKVNNVEEYFGRIIIPVEKQVEVKDGKKKIKNVKKLPGYLFVELEFNENVFLTLRETYGVGGFLDGGNLNRPPLPMPEIEVHRTLADQDDFHPSDGKKDARADADLPKMRIKLDISVGDRVKIKEGMFANMEGEVKEILDKDGPSPKLKVELSIWGRPVPVDVDHWQADKV
jgi:transcriptional antiterminator NusG